MTVKLSQNSFVSILTKSGLVDGDTLQDRLKEFQEAEPGGQNEGERLAHFLIRHGDLTTWQSKKLLQGKYKGFTLGKYKLLSLLGRGGMSSVYLAEHKLMRRRCAIKVLPSKQVKDEASLNRFHQEAQAVAALDDPNIVRAYDVDHVKDGNSEIHFLVMEYVEGRSLQEIVDQDGPLPIPVAIDYICQAAKGLEHAHEAGMVHRDIKPSNLLLDTTGMVKVLDMGLARFFEQTDQQSLTLQHDQRVLGTADYLSPEQAVDSHGVDTRSDTYSLGGTMYFLLAGHPPFPDGTLAQRLLAHQTKEPKSISEIRPDIPGSFSRILERMMAKNPDNRQQTVAEASRELQEWLEQNGDAFSSETPSSVARRQAKRPAEPTADGWSDLPPDGFTPAPTSGDNKASSSSNVVSDPNLGEFLTALSTQVDPKVSDSDRISSAQTVVSGKKKKKRVERTPVPSQKASGDSHVTADDSTVVADPPGSATLSGSHVRRRQSPVPLNLIYGGLCLVGVLIVGYLFWPSSDAPPASPAVATSANPDANDDAPPNSVEPTTTTDVRPSIDPGADITVGPDENFATINEALSYVRQNYRPLNAKETRTIRVAGGQTYSESILIDNSRFGAFPQGVKLICEDDKRAVLSPSGNTPIVSLINVERFHMQGFDIDGKDRPVGVHLEGYLLNTSFEGLSIRNVQSAAIRAVGIAGFARKQVTFRDVHCYELEYEAVGILLSEGQQPTKEVTFAECRFAGPMSAGIRIDSEAAKVNIRECRFHQASTGVAFTTSASSLESLTLSNNTFSDCSAPVQFAAVPSIGSRGVGFHKNLFVGSGGPAVSVAGGEGLKVQDLVRGAGASHNWTDTPGGLNIFQNKGRQDAPSITFTSTDPTNPAFLKPKLAELRTAARDASNPKFIGAVAPSSGR